MSLLLAIALPLLGRQLMALPALQPILQTVAPVADGGSGEVMSPAPGGAGASDEAIPAGYIRVELQVSCDVESAANWQGAVVLPQGANAYDALLGSGLLVNSRQTQFGIYVMAIDGVAERSHGSQSGWKYDLNDEFVPMSADKCVLSDGDVLHWYFSVDGWGEP